MAERDVKDTQGQFDYQIGNECFLQLENCQTQNGQNDNFINI